MMHWKHSKTVPEDEALDFVMELVRLGEDSFSHQVKDGMVTIEWGWSNDVHRSKEEDRGTSTDGEEE